MRHLIDIFCPFFFHPNSSCKPVTLHFPHSRRYKSKTVCVVKCRGSLPAASDPCSEVPEEGTMTGLTVTDRETGKSVTIPLSTIETETGKRKRVSGVDTSSTTVPSSINLDLITSDQYTQAYLDHLFSAKGPVAELENYFNKASERLRVLTTELGCKSKAGVANGIEKREAVHLKDQAEGTDEVQIEEKVMMERRGRQGEERLKLSIVESQLEQSLNSN